MFRRRRFPTFAVSSDVEPAPAEAQPPVWDLSDLYSGLDDPAIAQDKAEAARRADAFVQSYKGQLAAKLAEGGQSLAQAIADYEALEELIGRIASYASLRYAADTNDPAVGTFYGRTQEELTTVEGGLIFFRLELNDLEDEALEAGYAAPELARYRPWLDALRAFKPYQLAPDTEKLLHDKELTSWSAWVRLFDETIADMRFTVDGTRKSAQDALNDLSSSDGATRAAAATGLTEGFQSEIKRFTLIYNTLMKDKSLEDDLRGIDDPALRRHLSNQIEPEVIAALVTAVKEAYPQLSHRYYAYKARIFGKDTLNFWDRNAPWPQQDDPGLSWDQARALVLDAYGSFAPEMADVANRFFERGWIDAQSRPGKSPGAFAHPTVPSAHPFVLMNYLGKTRDVMTLAHELGHGVHQVLAAEQGLLLSQTPLTLAETASVFGEMLTFQRLIEEAPSQEVRRVLLSQKVEDMLNTVVRQIAFYDFETRVHAARSQGELATDDINAIWLEVQRESLGPAIEQNPGYELYWCYIPHFIHSPFYVYAYAFGDCLVNALYAQYANAREGFAERYFEMLRSGGSKRHGELLAPFGLDASDPSFWKQGLSVIGSLIDELETSV
ncbi:MAG: M3 family oligoendopeptidase [Pseudomonadota bacterium]